MEDTPFCKEDAIQMAREMQTEREAQATKRKLDEFEEFWDPYIQEALVTHALTVANRGIGRISDRCWQVPRLRAVSLCGLNLTQLGEIFSAERHGAIKFLSLASNCLQELPESLRVLTNLSELSVTRNKLEHLPDVFSGMRRLGRLFIAGNCLKSVPSSLSTLRIKRLDLSNNQLVTLPEEMARMPLESLLLNHNLMVALPQWLPELKHLRRLSATHNVIEHFPAWLHRCKSLQHLQLSSNAIASLPEEVGDMPTCTELILEWNHIERLPLSIARLQSKLRVLRLEGNPLKQPTLEYLRERGAGGLGDWAVRSKQQSTAKIDALVADHFYKVLRLVVDLGLAPPGVLCPDVWMGFEGRSAQHHCVDWKPFFEQSWPGIRRELSRRLPLVVLDDDEPNSNTDGSPAKGDGRSSHTAALVGHSATAAFEGESARPAKAGTAMNSRSQADLVDFWSLDADQMLRSLSIKTDATGPMVRTEVWGLFKSCTCVAQGISRSACIPPRPEYRCLRRCVAIKTKAESRKAIADEQQSAYAKAAIAAAAAGARLNAEAYCRTPQGKDLIMQRAKLAAEEEEVAQQREEHNLAVDSAFAHQRKQANEEHQQELSSLHALQQQELKVLRQEEASLCTKLEGLRGWKADMVRHEIARLEDGNEARTGRWADGASASSSGAAIPVAWGGTDDAKFASAGKGSTLPSAAPDGPPGLTVAAEDGTVLVGSAPVDRMGGEKRPGTAQLDAARSAKRPSSTAGAERVGAIVRMGPRHDVASKVRRLKERLQGMDEAELKATQRAIDAVRQTMREGGYAALIRQAKERHAARLADIEDAEQAAKLGFEAETGWIRSLRRWMQGDYARLLRKHWALEQEAYVRGRQEAGKAAAMERLASLRRVTERWQSAGLRRILLAWRSACGDD